MKPPVLSSLVAGLLTALCPEASASGVHLVDSSGAGDFVEVQAAVDAAADGDTILLRRPPEGTRRFRGFVIDGKGLSVVSLVDGELVTGAVTVRGLGAGQSVVLSGLTVGKWLNGSDYGPPAAALRIEDCAGRVRVQDCELQGWSPAFWTTLTFGRAGRPALEVRRSADTVVRDCVLQGGSGHDQLSAGGAGLVIDASTVALYDSLVDGGAGGDDYGLLSNNSFGGAGGAGVIVIGGTLYASACTIQGGPGGGAFYLDPALGGDGGAGLRVGAAASAFALDTDFAGGSGGEGLTQGGAHGAPVVGSLAVVPSAGERSLLAPSRAEELTSVPLILRGVPGETVLLLRSDSAAARPLGPQAGYLYVGAPFQRLDLGPLPASGELTHDFPAPDAPAGEARQVVLQAAFIGPGGGVRLSAPAHLFVFDAEAPPVCGRRLYVDGSATPGGDGESWATALRDLNAALVQAVDCPDHPTDVWVKEGSYTPAAAGGERGATFRLYAGTRLYGGFRGDETRLAQREPRAYPTLLSGDLDGDDGTDFSARDDNAFHVLRSGTRELPEHDVHVDGFVVRGGHADASAHQPMGGGILVNGRATLANCTLTDNAALNGGGVGFEGESVELVSCRVVGNFAERDGGGLYGSSLSGGRMSLVNSVIAGNSVALFGLGAAVRVVFDCSLELDSSLVYANDALVGGAGVVGADGFETRVANCILWGNGNSVAGQADQINAPMAVVQHSCIQGLDGSLGGAGNLGDDPLFQDRLGPDGLAGTLDDDLRLSSGSPCVDAGRNASVPNDSLDIDGDGDRAEPLPLDLDGLARFLDDPAAPDTGDGTAPLVDLGPHERQP